jgi:hypothetical protein
MKTRWVAMVGVALASIGCRAHPCGDRTAELPTALRDLPVVEGGGKVCYAREAEGEATIMYWGGSDVRNEVAVKLMAKMNDAGWSQYEPSGLYAPAPNPDVYRFRKGNERLYVDMKVDQTPRFGAKFYADSVRVALTHSVVDGKAGRSGGR